MRPGLRGLRQGRTDADRHGPVPALRQGEFRILHKSFTANDLIQVCQPRFPRSFPHFKRESSGPCRPAANDSGTTPDGLQPRLAKLDPAAERLVQPAGSIENARAVRPGSSQHGAARFPHRPGWAPATTDGLHGHLRARSRSTGRNESIAAPPRLSRHVAVERLGVGSVVVPDCARRALRESRDGGEPVPHPADPATDDVQLAPKATALQGSNRRPQVGRPEAARQGRPADPPLARPVRRRGRRGVGRRGGRWSSGRSPPPSASRPGSPRPWPGRGARGRARPPGPHNAATRRPR